jgi:hypothetical protein
MLVNIGQQHEKTITVQLGEEEQRALAACDKLADAILLNMADINPESSAACRSYPLDSKKVHLWKLVSLRLKQAIHDIRDCDKELTTRYQGSECPSNAVGSADRNF